MYLAGNEGITGQIGTWVELQAYVQGQHATSKEHNGSIATLLTTCDLVDVFTTQHSGKIPPTYTRGILRDLIMFSSHLDWWIALRDQACYLSIPYLMAIIDHYWSISTQRNYLVTIHMKFKDHKRED